MTAPNDRGREGRPSPGTDDLGARGAHSTPAASADMAHLRDDGRVGAVAGPDDGVTGQGHEPATDGPQDGRLVAVGPAGGTRATAEQRVPGEDRRQPAGVQRSAAGAVTRSVHRDQLGPRDLEGGAVTE